MSYWEQEDERPPASPNDRHWSSEEQGWHARRDCSRERCGYPAITGSDYDE